MEPIYHLVSRTRWEALPAEADYQAESLTNEGFIHCSFARQLAWAANRFHADTADLVALHIEPDRLTAELRIEPPTPDSTTTERFPHIYGPLNRSAVVAVIPLSRGEDGRWVFPQ